MDEVVRDRQRLHPIQGTIVTGFIDEDNFIIVPAAHHLTDRTDRGPDVILLVEARNDEGECGNNSHAGLSCGGLLEGDESRPTAITRAIFHSAFSPPLLCSNPTTR